MYNTISIDGRKINIKDILAIYYVQDKYIKNEKNYYVSVFTTHGSYQVYTQKERGEVFQVIKNAYEKFIQNKIKNFAFLEHKYLINMDKVKILDVMSTPWQTKELMSCFTTGHKLTIQTINPEITKHDYLLQHNSYKHLPKPKNDVLEI